MLRVGLTGGLGSGKSTVAKMLAAHGASTISADEIGRELMQPGQAVYAAIVERFGEGVVSVDGTLDRTALARIAFGDGHVEDLNAIVHPAAIARQAEKIAEIEVRQPDAVVVIESALIFETKFGGDALRERFDRIVLVRAPEELKIARFVDRSSSNQGAISDSDRDELIAEAKRRLGKQIDDNWKAARSDDVLTNDGSIEDLKAQVDALWPTLRAEAR